MGVGRARAAGPARDKQERRAGDANERGQGYSAHDQGHDSILPSVTLPLTRPSLPSTMFRSTLRASAAVKVRPNACFVLARLAWPSGGEGEAVATAAPCLPSDGPAALSPCRSPLGLIADNELAPLRAPAARRPGLRRPPLGPVSRASAPSTVLRLSQPVGGARARRQPATGRRRKEQDDG